MKFRCIFWYLWTCALDVWCRCYLWFSPSWSWSSEFSWQFVVFLWNIVFGVRCSVFQCRSEGTKTRITLAIRNIQAIRRWPSSSIVTTTRFSLEWAPWTKVEMTRMPRLLKSLNKWFLRRRGCRTKSRRPRKLPNGNRNHNRNSRACLLYTSPSPRD